MKKSDIDKNLSTLWELSTQNIDNINTKMENLKKLKKSLEGFRKKVLEGVEDIKNKYPQCPHCDYVFELKEGIEIKEEIVELEVPTYWDSGYGDDDKYATYQYFQQSCKCPRCGKTKILKSKRIRKIPGTERGK